MRPGSVAGRLQRPALQSSAHLHPSPCRPACPRTVRVQSFRSQPAPKLAFDGIGGHGNGGKRPGGGNGPWSWGEDGGNDDDEVRGDVSADAASGLTWKGWQDRVDADPSFRDKVLIEQIIGVAASVIGDMSSRPHWGLYELDFVFSTLVVGSILNFSLMYFLAPTATVAGGAAAGGLVQRLLGDHYLRKWGAPAGHLFEPGFPLSKRLVNFAYKGAIFGAIGFGAGVIGTSLSNGLLALRKRLDKSFVSQNKPPDVVLNASTWALHMGISSNLRYQMLNGFDMAVQPKMSPASFRILTSVLRMGNNALGGVSFVTLARLTGVQAAGSPDDSAELVTT